MFPTNMHHPTLIIDAMEMPKVKGRGRPKGLGSNINLLNRLVPDGNPVFDVPKNKMLSICATAWRFKIRVKVRRMVGLDNQPTGLYAIQRRSPKA